MDEPIDFTSADLQSGTWAKLSTHMRSRIKYLREKNDSETLTADETRAIRAKIAVYKALLDLEKGIAANLDGRQVNPTREALDY